MRIFSCALIVVSLLVFAPACSLGADHAALSDQELTRRLDFIEGRLDAGQRHASYWQKGWAGFYSVSTIAQTALWLDADDSDDSTNYVVGALKSAGGLVDALLRPMPGWKGAEDLKVLPNETREDKLQRLARGEALLEKTSMRAAERDTWGPHLKVVGVNLVAGAAIAAFGDEGDALVSSLLGIAIGEASIWSQPVNGLSDYQEYQTQFSAGQSQSRLHWEILPIPAGGMARLSCRW